MDNETWLIEIGDEVIVKKATSSYEEFSSMEKTIYCFWVVDYAVRNSGTLQPVEEIHPSAIKELVNCAQSNNWYKMLGMLKNHENEEEFSDKYYELFEASCNEIRSAYENT
jgi:hypothetical protein